MKIFATLLVLATLGLIAARADDKVIVHEWGTFTSLQDDTGHAIGGINVDDEPVPSFVWGGGGHVRSLGGRSGGGGSFGLPPYYNFSKGWNPADKDVTMRLETPVIYFYPPKGMPDTSVPPLDVQVNFHSGLLSQFYPYADSDGFPQMFRPLFTQHISSLTTGLTWKKVRLGSTEKPVETSDKVWTTPREVGASVLEVQSPIYNAGGVSGVTYGPQAEHFLFYRGIGQLDSPIKIRSEGLDPGFTRLHVLAEYPGELWNIQRAWTVQIRADGTCAFRVAAPLQTRAKGNSELGSIDLTASMAFRDSDFSSDRLASLKTSMQDALVEAGLYPDEATAMLKTWELSYFKSPGLRFFYIVPRTWTDQVLPLKITGAPTEITRVMVGRIELISEKQKTALARIALGPCPNLPALKQAASDALQKSSLSKAEKDAYEDGEKPIGELGLAIPPLLQDYLSLGRFRDALIVHEQQEHPSASLAQFIKDNGLAPSE